MATQRTAGSPTRRIRKPPPLAAVVLLLTVAISAMLVAIGWPAVRSSMHGVPIAIVGPQSATEQVEATLKQRQPGAFNVMTVPGTAAAERMILDREVYGAVDLGTDTPQVLIASAGGPLITQTLQAIASGLGQASGTTVAVRDLAPLPADDQRGAGLAAGSLPLVIGGMFAAILLTRLVRGTGRRLVGALGFAVTGGLALVAILQFWFGSLGGNFFANAGAVGLSVAATSLLILGLESLLGPAGLGIGAALVMLIGNPLAGTTSAPEMLPGWSGRLGQFLPPGAGASLLRSTAFFAGGGAGGHIAVLLMWLLIGIALCIAGGARTSQRTVPVLEAQAAA